MGRPTFNVGDRIARRRDGALARVVERTLAVPSKAHPGPWGQVVYTVRLDDEVERSKVGGDQVGPVSWIRSHFRKA